MVLNREAEVMQLPSFHSCHTFKNEAHMEGIFAPAAIASSASDGLYRINKIHTLGPQGTNCESAALLWRERHAPGCELVLHQTMEAAAEAVAYVKDAVLLSVVAYPKLHTIIYEYLSEFELIDMFIMRTDEMVLASVKGKPLVTCSTHPAPERLIPTSVERRFVHSNAQAAIDCVAGLSDCCLTTMRAALDLGLVVVTNFGRVPMGFTIHAPISRRWNMAAARSADVSIGI